MKSNLTGLSGQKRRPRLWPGLAGASLWIIPWLMSCLLSPAALGQGDIHVTGANITEVGIYASQVITSQTNSMGIKLQGLDEFKLLSATTNIPARVGTRFGFRFEIFGAPPNAPILLTMVARHPPLSNSVTGRAETSDTYRLKSWIGKTYTSGSLEQPSDCVPGPWTFEVWHEDKKLCEQSFMVVPDSGFR